MSTVCRSNFNRKALNIDAVQRSSGSASSYIIMRWKKGVNTQILGCLNLFIIHLWSKCAQY